MQYAAQGQFDSDDYDPVHDLIDIHQLGAVLQKLFTISLPFEGQPFEVVHVVKHETPTKPSAVADAAEEPDGIVRTALATDRSERYESVLYLRDALQHLPGSP